MGRPGIICRSQNSEYARQLLWQHWLRSFSMQGDHTGCRTYHHVSYKRANEACPNTRFDFPAVTGIADSCALHS